jgi:hypothetical protein
VGLAALASPHNRLPSSHCPLSHVHTRPSNAENVIATCVRPTVKVPPCTPLGIGHPFAAKVNIAHNNCFTRSWPNYSLVCSSSGSPGPISLRAPATQRVTIRTPASIARAHRQQSELDHNEQAHWTPIHLSARNGQLHSNMERTSMC